MAKSKFVYRGDKRTVESIVRKSKHSGGAYDSYLSSEVQLLKVKDGESTVRILPPSWPEKDDDKWGPDWDIQVFLHYSVGPDNGTYLCQDKMGSGVCPICEARRQATDDERDQMKPQSRFLCWVIDRDNEKAGPQVWSMPVSVLREINMRSVDKKHNTPIPIDDPEDGYDVTFSREGAGIKTKYYAFEVGRDPTPLHDDEKLQNRWLDYISEHTLPDVLQFYDAEHVQSVLFGKTERGAGNDDGEKRGTRRERPARTGHASASASDEDDYLDEDEDEKKPTRGKPVRGGRAAPEPDEDEDEDDTSNRKTARVQSRRAEPEEVDDEDDEPEEKVKPRGSKSRLADPKEEPDDDEEEVEEESTVKRARGKLDAMTRRRSGR